MDDTKASPRSPPRSQSALLSGRARRPRGGGAAVSPSEAEEEEEERPVGWSITSSRSRSCSIEANECAQRRHFFFVFFVLSSHFVVVTRLRSRSIDHFLDLLTFEGNIPEALRVPVPAAGFGRFLRCGRGGGGVQFQRATNVFGRWKTDS
ncbi:unnamed protein product [Calypogeia fissa]